MLSNAAANALLKTLEEPPGHVVFVLATTDPQKVPPTIRSRTQHFEFRLLGAETLAGLVHDVNARAGLQLGEEALAVAVRRGRGSARDALSALDQVAAAGSVSETRPELATVVDALCAEDAAKALLALSALHEAGWGPQQLAVELVDELRQSFLVALAPQLADATGSERRRLAGHAEGLGLPRLVRAMELLGRAQVDMREAPDPRVVLEVAVVRLARPDLDESTAALADRVWRLEQRLAAPGGGAPAGGSPHGTPTEESAPAVPPPSAGASAPVAPGAPGGRPTIGALRRQRAAASTPPGPAGPSAAPAGAPRSAPETPGGATGSPGSTTSTGPPGETGSPAPTLPDRDSLVEAWGDHVLRSLPARAKAVFGAGRFVAVGDGHAEFALPNAAHRDRAEEVRPMVESALGSHFGAPVPLRLVVDDDTVVTRSAPSGGGARGMAAGPGAAGAGGGGGRARSGGAGERAGSGEPEPVGTAGRGPAPENGPRGGQDDPDDVDPDDVDPDDPGLGEVESVAQARLLEAFPGAEEVTE